MMTVAELIAFLNTQPQDLLVATRCHSEYCLLAAADIATGTACEPRLDGWVQNARPDKPTRNYLFIT